MNPIVQTKQTASKVHRSERAQAIRVEDYALGSRTDLLFPLYEDGLGNKIDVPFIVVRGREPGPVLGISAAVHGNELNGIKIIHNLLQRIDPDYLRGSLLCAPVVNVPAFNAGQRYFSDGRDLNHAFPGKKDGRPVEQYARAFEVTFLPDCQYHIDIHTASEGRVNTMYVRADLHNAEAYRLARLMNPQIILHARGGDGTLRNAARRRGIPGITVEAGNPSVFQGRMVFEGEAGILNVMTSLDLLPGQPLQQRDPVICKSSRWLRTTGGGLLETRFSLFERISKRQVVAETSSPFGHLTHRYQAPFDGIVIGMAASPVAVPGTRYCHLGNIGEPEPKKEAKGEAVAAQPSEAPVAS